MRVKVLGSAAGGGFPQWNCSCSNCSGLRAGTLRGHPRAQTQLAVAPAGASQWYLLNASPDLRQQILGCPELAPADGRSPIGGVILTSADVDSVLGLLHLREFTPLRIFATAGVRRVLTEENSLFRTLARSAPPVSWVDLLAGPSIYLEGATSNSSGANAGGEALQLSTIALAGGYPDYVSSGLRADLPAGEAAIALVISNGRAGDACRRIFFAPSLPPAAAECLRGYPSSDVSFLDGTFWSDDELQRTGRSVRTAREIGHLPLSGSSGLLATCPPGVRGRKILIHINNTNPILDEESTEHRAVLDAGWEIAYDGMEFEL